MEFALTGQAQELLELFEVKLSEDRSNIREFLEAQEERDRELAELISEAVSICRESNAAVNGDHWCPALWFYGLASKTTLRTWIASGELECCYILEKLCIRPGQFFKKWNAMAKSAPSRRIRPKVVLMEQSA